jgi:hypothetical protein
MRSWPDPSLLCPTPKDLGELRRNKMRHEREELGRRQPSFEASDIPEALL